MTDQFHRLFSPLNIGTMTVPNRIFMPGHHHRLSPGAVPNDRMIAYFEARAKGGAGLIISSVHHVHRVSSAAGLGAVHRDSSILLFTNLAESVHKYGTKIITQLGHRGGKGDARILGGVNWAPSPFERRTILPPPSGLPHEMDIDEIKEVIDSFGDAAMRMKRAGIDGVEIQAIYGFLLGQFISPAFNFRKDDYGGSAQNRLRFIIEVIDSIRNAVGSDYVVGIRISGDEFLDGGLKFDDMKSIAVTLEATGKLDYISICTGVTDAVHLPSMYFPLAAFVYLAAGIKEVVDLPVFTAGRINDPVLAENILAEGQADMIGMARGLIADPDLPLKAREGRLDDIRHCIGCNEGCVGIPLFSGTLTCTVNPEAGNEKEFAPIRAALSKKVMIIGGGAAGLETARVAALRGHRVSLYEKKNELGGQVNIACLAPGRVDFAEVSRYYTHQMKLLDIEVQLNSQVTQEKINKQNPDVVVIATGSIDVLPSLPGAENTHIVSVRDVLEGKVTAGQKVLIIALEQHSMALCAADFLADRNRKAEIITETLYAGAQLDRSTLEAVYPRLLKKGIIITPLTGVREILGSTIVVYNVLSGVERRIEGIDTIVVAAEPRADDFLYRSLKGKVKELYAVGQCLAPRRLLDSIHDGARVGRLI